MSAMPATIQETPGIPINAPESVKIRICPLPHAHAPGLPQYATDGAAGMDLCAALGEEPVELPPGERALVPTGLSIALPPGFEAQIRPRSGLALKYGISVLNAPGTIDADYRGEIKVILANLGTESFTIAHGMRIAQMVIARYARAEWELTARLDDTARGTGGFGSTGMSGG